MPKLNYKCIMLMGTPDPNRPLHEQTDIERCNAPAANCSHCKQPFCAHHFLIHSQTCPPPKVGPTQRSVSREAGIDDLDDLAEEHHLKWEAEDDRQREEREQYYADDQL